MTKLCQDGSPPEMNRLTYRTEEEVKLLCLQCVRATFQHQHRDGVKKGVQTAGGD